jgi:hypothetical protein
MGLPFSYLLIHLAFAGAEAPKSYCHVIGTAQAVPFQNFDRNSQGLKPARHL